MKKKIIFYISIVIILITSIILIVLLIGNNNNSKSEKLAYEKFKNILINFDVSNNYTITANDEKKLDKIIYKIENNKFSIKNSNDDQTKTIYYEKIKQKLYKYYYENGKWIKREVHENPYNLNFNLSQYKEYYEEFEYDYKNDIYVFISSTENISSIKIQFKDDKIVKLDFNNGITYSIAYYNTTRINLPSEAIEAFDKATSTEWELMLNDALNNNNFSALAVKIQKSNETVLSSSAYLVKVDNEKKYIRESISNVTTEYFYEIKSSYLYEYKKNIYVWDSINSTTTTNERFTQGEMLPIALLDEVYDKIEYNELASSYKLQSLEYNDKLYHNITIIVTDNKIGYISINYSNISFPNVVYEEIIEFYDFSTTTIDIDV